MNVPNFNPSKSRTLAKPGWKQEASDVLAAIQGNGLI